MRISVLNENTAGKRGFLAEHGLSLLIEYEGKRLLFDTGQTDVFLQNAGKMGEDLRQLDAIILSHGHFDHCGGMEYFKDAMPSCPVYVRKNAFLNKQAVNEDKKTYRIIGIPWKRALLNSAEVLTRDRQEIFTDVWVLGNIPYTVPFEKKPEIFFIDEEGKKRPDYMEDEQLLVIDSQKGLCVFAGCCHAGIINCLNYVKTAFPGRPLFSVTAGMHLNGVSEERLEKTLEALEQMQINHLMPVHCTGVYAIGRMKERLKDRCTLLETGKTISF